MLTFERRCFYPLWGTVFGFWIGFLLLTAKTVGSFTYDVMNKSSSPKQMLEGSRDTTSNISVGVVNHTDNSISNSGSSPLLQKKVSFILDRFNSVACWSSSNIIYIYIHTLIIEVLYTLE